MKIIFLVLALLLVSCSRVWVKEDMQPDHSYKIIADGNGPASLKQVRESAIGRATMLCTNGFEKRAEVPDDSFKPSYTLIVVCK